MLRAIAIIAVCLVVPAVASAGSVKGYTTKKGTYVAPYKRSASNGTQRDNYSSKGNVNPYTGKSGTKTAKK